LLHVYGLTISVPKGTDKYYHARVNFRDGESEAKGILYNPKRQLLIDGSGYHDSVFILMEQANIPAVTVDAIQSVKILKELSQAECESVAAGIKKLTDRNQ